MARARLIVRLSVLGVVLLLVGVAFFAPVQATNAVKGTFHALPKGLRDAVSDDVERNVGGALDDYVLSRVGDDPRALINLAVSLTDSDPGPGGWTGTGDVRLEWAPHAHQDIRFRVTASRAPSAAGATVIGTFDVAEGTVRLPDEGKWYLFVRPFVDSKDGRVSPVGSFSMDSTGPSTPMLQPRGDPGGYSFTLSWSVSIDEQSGVSGYEVGRRAGSGDWKVVQTVAGTSYFESNVGNGEYTYRVRALNGGNLDSDWSPTVSLVVNAPMNNPGVGAKDFGIFANYTSFLHVWDLDPRRYLDLDELSAPQHADTAQQHLGPEWGIDTENQTLRKIVSSVVGQETNTMEVAQKLFLWLYDRTDYDHSKASGPNQQLLRAGQTLDRGGGICGDLAVLYITVLRIAGVPARPVHGYLDNDVTGGEFHMWVEVYVGGDPDYPWMTVDVSGAGFEVNNAENYGSKAKALDAALLLFFGVFNPDYLSLGTELVYDPPDAEKASWNAWARFQWTCTGTCDPDFSSGGDRMNLAVDERFMLVNINTLERQIVAKDANQESPRQDQIPKQWNCQNQNCFSFVMNERVSKRIDYGVSAETLPSNLKKLDVELRYPVTDDFAALNPWQSVIFTVYERGAAVPGPFPADGFVLFEQAS